MPTWSILLVSAILTLAATTHAQSDQVPQQVFDRAIADFKGGRVAEAAAGFDNLVKLVPALKPQLWQRGIALYYAGRYRDCRDQFESHRTVNPNDVENAAWHFLCVARAESPDKARSALLPVGPDSRVPMPQIYEMFRSKLSPQEVLASAGDLLEAQFYAQLYLGLYFEGLGNDRRAREHIEAAAADRFSSAGGFMHTVAKVHLLILRRQKQSPPRRIGQTSVPGSPSPGASHGERRPRLPQDACRGTAGGFAVGETLWKIPSPQKRLLMLTSAAVDSFGNWNRCRRRRYHYRPEAEDLVIAGLRSETLLTRNFR